MNVEDDFFFGGGGCLYVTFSNISAISWRPVLLVEEAGVPGENHRPWASNCGRLAHTKVDIYLRFYYYHWVDTSTGRLLVPEGINRPVVSVSALK